MSSVIEDKITEYRQKQPLYELIRKFNKAKGRHSKNYWIQESIDFTHAIAAGMESKMVPLPLAD